MLNSKVTKMIRKYAKLRGQNSVALNYKVLKKVYEKANPLKKRIFRKDMENYFGAVEKGLIKPGESYILAGFTDKDVLEIEGKSASMQEETQS